MSYDLRPKNEEAGGFHFGAFSYPILLEACGYLFPCVHESGRWYCAFGEDSRMPVGDKYPQILSNSGFEVTEEEALIMARIARNFVVIQRTLPEQSDMARDDYQHGIIWPKENWPVKIREDFVEKFEEFSKWTVKSGGFSIY